MALEKVALLVVEDNEADFRLVTEYLKESPEISFEVTRTKCMSDAIKMIAEKKFDAALLDLDLPDSKGLSIIDKFSNSDPAIAMLVLTGIDDDKLGIEAVKKGAQDYLAKGRMSGGLLYRSIRYAMERKRAEEILQRDKDTLDKLVKEKTEELLKAREELAKAKRLSDIGTLAATVAHELRNPLAAIGMAAHNIKRKAKMPELDKHLSNIEKKIAESDQIINNLLFFSRIKPPSYEKTSLYDIVKECVSTRIKTIPKKVSIKMKMNDLRKVDLEVDPVQITEVITNILNNAYDAVPELNGKIEIIGSNEEDIRIYIKDNGSGIDKEHLEKVFDPFFTTKTKGTGLGLSVCQQIVNLHNGSIFIESDIGKGTVVTVCLPKQRISGR